MALNLYDQKVVNDLVKQVAELRRQQRDGRTNQVNRLVYGHVVIDGDLDNIVISDNSDNDIITLDSLGLHVKDTSGHEITLINSTGVHIKDVSGDEISVVDSTGFHIKDSGGDEIITLDTNGITVKGSTSANQFVTFQDSGTDENVGTISYGKYTSGSDHISDFIIKTIEASDNQRIAYNTLQISKHDNSRDVFLQMNVQYNSGGTFVGSSLNYAKDGQTGTFVVQMTGTDGSGYMDIPVRTSDPSGTGRRMYYNSSTGKFRGFDGAWKSFTLA